MQNIFILNPNATITDFKDAIYVRINKVKAILTCAMFTAEVLQKNRHLGAHSLYHILWTVDDSWEEIEKFFQQLEKKS